MNNNARNLNLMTLCTYLRTDVTENWNTNGALSFKYLKFYVRHELVMCPRMKEI
jgi:hypothetical protein